VSAHASYDVVVVGTGSGGKIAAIELARHGRRVLAVERFRFGGECPYVACVPSKALLLAARAGLSWAEAVERRDAAVADRDDSGSVRGLTDEGVDVRRGHARLAGSTGSTGSTGSAGSTPASGAGHRVEITPTTGSSSDVETLDAAVVVLAPGSRPVRPPIDGLAAVPTWTSDEALSTRDQPGRLVVLGGGAVGCELAQAFARLGTSVHLVEAADGLLPGEAAFVGELVGQGLREDGVQVSTSVTVEAAEPLDAGRAVRLRLAGGGTIEAERVLLAGGRRPNSEDLGLGTVEARVEESGSVAVDARCRVLDGASRAIPGLYAVGDVTDESSYTHSANYQARVVTADVIGAGYDADYVAVPRVVYVEPSVFCVGVTEEQARERGLEVATAAMDVGEVERATLQRGVDPMRYPDGVRGRLELVADVRTGVLVGASCVGPEADSWGAELALAVRARLDVRLLAQHLQAFLSWPEAIQPAARELAGRMGA
jgi:pyruvate/2-oxoglutarate dehydrogenase complex dihydrolipoamide dehydrogenase (E3) component